MSFRSRLTLLFVVIVGVTMTGFGVLVFRLISDSEAGKTDARLSALAGATVGAQREAEREVRPAARRVASDPVLAAAMRRGDEAAARRTLETLRVRERLVRLQVVVNGRVLADAGRPEAFAPARQPVRFAGVPGTADVLASNLVPRRLADAVAGPDVHVAIRRAGRIVFTDLPGGASAATLPARGTRTIGSTDYSIASFVTPDFSGTQSTISVLVPSRSGDSSGLVHSRLLVVGLLLGFLVLAFLCALLVGRALQEQVARLLGAARRLGGGDFSTPVPVEGRDDFAKLGQEFNTMATQLETRMEELRRERARLQEWIRRIGQTFAANLDSEALIELGVQTAVDAVQAAGGRATLRAHDGSLAEAARAGILDGAGDAVRAAENEVLETGSLAVVRRGEVDALATPLGDLGLLSVARTGRPFDPSERELFSSLAGQAAVSIENVGLHEQIHRQALTDGLTGLANHRHFQARLAAELERARRFDQEVGLVMLDVDDFKRVNDTFGHPQGDEVLRAVALALRESSRDVDAVARYGGEEMAVVLPQTDLEGAWQAAERAREAIERLRIPRLDGQGELAVTASFGVAAGAPARPAKILAGADRALYEAKHSGKNRSVRGEIATVDHVS